MAIFTSAGTIQREYHGRKDASWVLRAHHSSKFIKAFASFEDCIEHVYPPTIEYHRNPTAYELRFGEGAIHYRSFAPIDCVNSDGRLKQWFVAADEGVRYYR